MNIEQLQAMSDDELNELSAMAILGWTKIINPTAIVTVGYVDNNGDKVSYRSFDPTNDMNDAMKLVEKIDGDVIIQKSVRKNEYYVSVFNEGTKVVSDWMNSAPRAIAIASILAKTNN